MTTDTEESSGYGRCISLYIVKSCLRPHPLRRFLDDLDDFLRRFFFAPVVFRLVPALEYSLYAWSPVIAVPADVINVRVPSQEHQRHERTA